jgi:hypothetical protein
LTPPVARKATDEADRTSCSDFVCATLVLPRLAAAQTAAALPPSITTPDKVESSLGTLDFKDGAPSKDTVAKAYDYLDLMQGVEAFVNAYGGASVAAIFKGLEDAGVPNNTVPTGIGNRPPASSAAR